MIFRKLIGKRLGDGLAGLVVAGPACIEHRGMQSVFRRRPGRVAELLADQLDKFVDRRGAAGYQLLCNLACSSGVSGGDILEDGNEFT